MVHDNYHDPPDMEAPPPYSEQDAALRVSISRITAVRPRGLEAIQAQRNIYQEPDQIHASSTSGPLDISRSPATCRVLNEFENVASASAIAFFESRPAAVMNVDVSTLRTHSILIAPSTRPHELEYPSILSDHDVRTSDWLTFTNFLLLDHTLHIGDGRMLANDDLDDGIRGLEADNKPAAVRGMVTRSILDNSERLNATTAEWNNGFFHPRGLHMVITAESPGPNVVETARTDNTDRTVRKPGTWIPYDHEIIGESSSAGRKRGFFKGFHNSYYGGFRMGPIIADNEGLRMGNIFKADQKGVRVGGSKGFVADDSGVSMGGKSIFKRDSNDRDRARRTSAGRPRQMNRSVSVSSISSTTSEESSGSCDSSCGSLPDYDDLDEQQLLVTKQGVLKLLNQNERPITKVQVSQIRDEILQSQERRLSYDEPDSKLRREVRELLRAFRNCKKQQEVERRNLQRAKRMLHKTRRKERRDARRESRRSKLEVRSLKVKEPKLSSWTTYHATLELPAPQSPPLPPLPERPTFTHVLGAPVVRAASVPLLRPILRNTDDEPSPLEHRIESAQIDFPRILARSPSATTDTIASLALPGAYPTNSIVGPYALYSQAHAMDEVAIGKHERAVWLRNEAASGNCDEHEHCKKLRHADALDEQAGRYWRDAERLRAQALRTDPEFGNLYRQHEASGPNAQHVLPLQIRSESMGHLNAT